MVFFKPLSAWYALGLKNEAAVIGKSDLNREKTKIIVNTDLDGYYVIRPDSPMIPFVPHSEAENPDHASSLKNTKNRVKISGKNDGVVGISNPPHQVS